MFKKITLLLVMTVLISCTSTEYKGNSGTDLGKKKAKQVRFDGTDYYKIYGEDLPKDGKKVVPTTSTTVKKTDTKTSTSGKSTVKTGVTSDYKKADTKDTADYLFPIKNPAIKKSYKEGSYSGIDFSVAKNSDIYSVAPGMVIFADEKPSLGKAIFIYHNNGYVSIYTNLDKLNLKKGDYVSSSKDVIAKASDDFGFEFRKRTDEGTIPLDPNKYLKKR